LREAPDFFCGSSEWNLRVPAASGRRARCPFFPMFSSSHAPRKPAEEAQVALIKSSSRTLQRQVDLTTAVCQERLLTTHVKHVLALVDLVADRMPFDDALDIYVRILRLTPELARNVGSRALAELGRRGGDVVAEEAQRAMRVPEVEPEEEVRPGGARPDALFARLRRRVRGRVQDELRERINLAAARTEDGILETHVHNSLSFARALSAELAASESIEMYLETMMLPEGFADVVYNRALSIIAEQVLPPIRDDAKEEFPRIDVSTLRITPAPEQQ
jgi:hypothetical protein